MSASNSHDRFVRGASATLASMPAAVLALFTTLLLHAWLRTGEWPHPRSGNPFDDSYVATTIDPKELGLHYEVVWFALLGLGVTAPIGLAWLLVTAWKRSWRPHPAYAAFYVIGVTAWFVLIALDSGVFGWFMD